MQLCRDFLLNCNLESSKQDITRIPVPFTEPISAWSQQRENFPHSTLPLPHTTFIAFSIASNHSSSTAKLPPQGQVAMGLQNNSVSCDTNLISSIYGIDLTPLLLFSFTKLQVALNVSWRHSRSVNVLRSLPVFTYKMGAWEQALHATTGLKWWRHFPLEKAIFQIILAVPTQYGEGTPWSFVCSSTNAQQFSILSGGERTRTAVHVAAACVCCISPQPRKYIPRRTLH